MADHLCAGCRQPVTLPEDHDLIHKAPIHTATGSRWCHPEGGETLNGETVKQLCEEVVQRG